MNLLLLVIYKDNMFVVHVRFEKNVYPAYICDAQNISL